MNKDRITKTCVLYIITLMFSVSFALSSTIVGLSPDEQRIFDLVNQARQQNRLQPLQCCGKLCDLARLKAKDMVDNNYFSHNSPTYGSPFDMMKNNGVSYTYAGENIAGNPTAEGAFNSWMNSSGHRANILNPNYTHIGIGKAEGGPYGAMWVQMFVGGHSCPYDGQGTANNNVQQPQLDYKYRIEGYVKDTSGNKLPSATVKIDDWGTTTTDSNGYYKFGINIPAYYVLTASKNGYNTNSVKVYVDGSVPIVKQDIVLTPIQSQPTGNLALNKPTMASSGNPMLAVDGNISTYWESSSATNQWINVNLGSVKFNQLKIIWGTKYPIKFSINVSYDAKSWTTVYTKTNNTGSSFTLNWSFPVSYKYIGVYCYNSNSNVHQIKELSIFNTSANNNVIQLVNFDFDDVVTIPAEKNIVRKVVTPNNDGVNDFVVFEDITFYKAFPFNQVDNNIKIRIFDLTGKIVREICNTEIWDGKDDTGNKVSAGVYIYQYKLGNEIKTGSIIIAR